MRGAILSSTNGAAAFAPREWMQQTVQQFFSAFNWQDTSPDLQQLQQSLAQNPDQPLSLTLSVSQFLGAINWENSAIGSSISPAASFPEPSTDQSFTLDELSDLF